MDGQNKARTLEVVRTEKTVYDHWHELTLITFGISIFVGFVGAMMITDGESSGIAVITSALGGFVICSIFWFIAYTKRTALKGELLHLDPNNDPEA